MNTVVSRPVEAPEPRAAVLLRAFVITTVLCAAVFACAFAIGRLARPASEAREQLSSTLSVASTGAAVPVRLSSVPSIATERLAVKASPAGSPSRALAAQTPAPTAPAPQPSLVSTAPSAPAAAAPAPAPSQAVTPAASVPAVSNAPSSTHSQAPTNAPSPPTGSGGASDEAGGSTSFDSSG